MTNNTDRLQAMTRCMSVMAAFEILMDFISPAMWVLSTPSSIIAKVAGLSLSGRALGVVWLIAALLVVPFVLMQCFSPHYRHRRHVIKLCNYGNISGGLIWFFMAFLARDLDYDFITLNFLLNGFGAFALAALLANSLNNDLIEGGLTGKKGTL